MSNAVIEKDGNKDADASSEEKTEDSAGHTEKEDTDHKEDAVAADKTEQSEGK